MTLSDLKHKDVIQFKTGENLGRVDDIRFDEVTSRLQSIILYGRQHLFGLLGREEDRYIPWSSVRRFGEDIILVEQEPQSRPPRRRR